MHDSTGITIALTVLSLSLSLPLSAFKQGRMHKPVPQGGVTKLWTRYMCLFLTHSSVAAVFNLYRQACCSTWAPIKPHKSAKFTLMLHIAAQTSSTPCYSNLMGQSWIQLQRQNVQEETGTGHPGSTWTHWTSMQGWNQEDQHPGGVETDISTGLEECDRQQRLHRYSSDRRESRVSLLLDRDGEEELMKCTENVRYLLISLPQPSLVRSPLKSPTLLRLCPGERNTTRVRQFRDKMHVQAGQYMHPWFTRADQHHSFLQCSSKWSSSPGTGKKPQCHTA